MDPVAGHSCFGTVKINRLACSTCFKPNSFDSYRNVTDIVLTKHVKCRMDCRKVTLEEIIDIIENGTVNNQKSGIGKKGDSTFAIGGISIDRQHLRVVVMPKKNGQLVVITCIDLEKEWPCNCN